MGATHLLFGNQGKGVPIGLPLRRRGGFSLDDIDWILRCEADAITGVSDTDPFQPWPDTSGNDNHLAQIDDNAYRPTYHLNVQNGLPAVRFDGVDDYLRAAFTLTQPCTVFVAADFTDNVGSIYDGYGGNNLARLYRDANDLNIWAGSAVTLFVQPSGWHIVTVVFNGASSSGQLDDGTPTTGNPGTTDPDGITLGNIGGLISAADIDVGVVLVASKVLSNSEIANVVTLLKKSWV